LRRTWAGRGADVVPYAWFVPAEVESLHRAWVAAAPPGQPVLDDPTWRDLELGRYLDALARHTSLFGRQMLVHRLRASTWLAPGERLHDRLNGHALDGVPDRLDEPVQAPAPALDREAALDAAWSALQPLRTVDIDLAGLLWTDPLPTAPAWVRHLWAVPLAFAVTAALALAGQFAAAALLGVATGVASARAQILLHGPLQQWQRQRRALLVLLRAARDSATHSAAAAGASPLLQAVQAQAAPARSLLRELRPGWSDRIPALAEYANLLALTQYRRWGRALERLPTQRAALQQVLLAVAGLEADLTLRGHLRHGPATCRAEPMAGRAVAFSDLVHPLITDAHPLALRLDGQGAFITGQNGVGKSTLLRSVGLNVVVGQAFGFCYARQAQVPRLPVCSRSRIHWAPPPACTWPNSSAPAGSATWRCNRVAPCCWWTRSSAAPTRRNRWPPRLRWRVSSRPRRSC
jgi:hypothetical protein